MRQRSATAAPLVGGMLLAAALVTGCAPAAEPSGAEPAPISAANVDETDPAMTSESTLLTEGSAYAEYQATIAEITEPLPVGEAYPPGLPEGFIPDPREGVMEAGNARNMARYTWLCAWEGEYLDAYASGDADRRSAAESMISAWMQTDFYRNVIVDPEEGWRANVVEPMLQGDPGGVGADHASMCSSYPTVSAD